MNAIATLEEARTKRYGYVGWTQKAYKEGFCVESVCGNGRGDTPHQCRRKNGHGPAGLYCGFHDPAKVEAKKEQRYNDWQAKGKSDREYRERQSASVKACEGMADPAAEVAALRECAFYLREIVTAVESDPNSPLPIHANQWRAAQQWLAKLPSPTP